jgi:hypothetical protein
MSIIAYVLTGLLCVWVFCVPAWTIAGLRTYCFERRQWSRLFWWDVALALLWPLFLAAWATIMGCALVLALMIAALGYGEDRRDGIEP